MYRTNSNGAVVFTAPFSLSKKSYDFSDRSHPRRAHGLSAKPTNRTLARIEVFFAPGNAGASEGYIIPPKSETTVHSVVSDFFSASDEICPTPLK